MIKASGLYEGDAASAPAPVLAPKDKRYDPIVGAGLVALGRALERGGLADPATTAILGITDRGCEAHVAKVTAGILEGKPRQAMFARAGAHTIATYVAMALDCHGPALTLSGGAATAATAWQIAIQLLARGAAGEVILLGADRVGDQLIAAAVVLAPGAVPPVVLGDADADASPVTYLRAIAAAHGGAAG